MTVSRIHSFIAVVMRLLAAMFGDVKLSSATRQGQVEAHC